MITVVDYGMGNLGSIANMIKYIGHKCEITSNASRIKRAEKIILPGVGHFDKAMQNISSLGLKDIIEEKALHERVPFLGICLGMQLMTKKSEEGEAKGLSFIDASVKRFSFDESENLKVPHMGWNLIDLKKNHNFIQNLPSTPRFYFVHSYHVCCNDYTDILTTTNYGYDFISSFSRDNLFGVQFHPEKSHKFGMALFENFSKI